jgi:hypothetical protein
VAELLIVFSLLLALAIGVTVNRRWTAAHADQGLEMSDLVNPITTIAAILLAFVMVEALASFDRAREDAGVEASLMEDAAEVAARLADQDLARDYQADLVCYSRAVRVQEWPSMANGGDPSGDVQRWTDDFELILAELRRSGGDDELDRLIDLDQERGDARLARLSEADPSLPQGMVWLMYGSILASIFGLAMFMKPGHGRRTNVALLVIFGALIGGSLVTIIDLDRPFDGINRIEPTAFVRTEGAMERDFAARYPGAAYPCDAGGIDLRVQ